MRFDQQVRIPREEAKAVCVDSNLVGGVKPTSETKYLRWLCYTVGEKHYIALYEAGCSADLDSVFEADASDIEQYSVDSAKELW